MLLSSAYRLLFFHDLMLGAGVCCCVRLRQMSYSESPVSAIFGGKLQSSVHRLGKKESATVQPFFSLQLDIQVNAIRDGAVFFLCSISFVLFL